MNTDFINRRMITIKYSKNFELRRVFDTVHKIDWYRKMGYKPLLPGGFSVESDLSELKIPDIKKLINKEYKKEDYKKVAFAIKNKSFIKSLPEKFEKIGLKYRKTYYIFLTKYGVGGSYKTPDKIILNINKKKSGFIITTIIHEIIHLSIEGFIQKNKISHWQKERLVDLIMAELFPKIAKPQKLPKEAYKADKIFAKLFVDKTNR